MTVCVMFSLVIQFLFIDFISFLYEQETYVVYALILPILLHDFFLPKVLSITNHVLY
jgi:hypothetical protein